MLQKRWLALWAILGLAISLAACTPVPQGDASQSGKLKVVATTTIVGDVVRQIGGEAVQVTTLLPPGTDPHSFQPTPQDVAKVAEAKLIFANGAGLEVFLQPMLENANSSAEIVMVSDGIKLLASQEVAPDAATKTPNEPDSQTGGDPHTWFDPNNVVIWTENIEKKLSAADPSNAQSFRDNAEKYRAQLRDLDAWIRDQIAQVPESNRQLVTDHASFTYFAVRYGFQQTGAVIPGYSTLAEPSAQEMARLENTIRQFDVKAVFVGETVNPNLAERVAQDTGVRLVYLYTGALTGADGPAPTYLDLMRYDVAEIVKALK